MSTRAAAWLAWSLWTLALMSFAVSGVFRSLNSFTPTIDPRTPLFLDFWYLLLFMSFATVGALVASRQPGNAIGWIFCWLGLSFPLASTGEEYSLYALVTEPGSLPGGEGMAWLVALFGGPLVFALFALVFLLFPDGRLLSRRWRPVVWLDLQSIVCLIAWAFEPGPLGNLGLVSVANPIGVEGAAALLDKLGNGGLILTLAVAVAGGISLVLRFRRARGEERQQLKWFAFSGVVFCAVFAAGPVL
jgi:two-component system NarL family sensor kinase